jgi:hypothetical protein
MAEPVPRDPHRRSAEQALAAHRSLGRLAARLESADDLASFTRHLAEFHDVVQRHFASEAAADGFLAMLRKLAPRHVRRIERLLVEHDELLDELAALVASVQAAKEAELGMLQRVARNLLARLRAHEADEDELLRDAVDKDVRG